jgi:hypothetical protein
MSQIRNRGDDALFDMKTLKVINYEQIFVEIRVSCRMLLDTLRRTIGNPFFASERVWAQRDGQGSQQKRVGRFH